jgi:IclR family acetate operon transcriptional repressor
MMAISISGPESRMTWDFVAKAAPVVREVARELADDLNNQAR